MNSINHLLHQAWKILSSPEHKQIETRGDRFGGGRIKPMSGRSVNTSLPCTPPTAQSFAPRNKFLFTRGSGISAVLIQRVCWTGSSSEMSLQQHFLSWAARKLLKVIPSLLITTFGGCFIVQRAKPDSSFASAARELWTSTTTLSLRYPDTISREHTLSYR